MWTANVLTLFQEDYHGLLGMSLVCKELARVYDNDNSDSAANYDNDKVTVMLIIAPIITMLISDDNNNSDDKEQE